MGTRADPTKTNLLTAATEIIHYNTNIGTEVIVKPITPLTEDCWIATP